MPDSSSGQQPQNERGALLFLAAALLVLAMLINGGGAWAAPAAGALRATVPTPTPRTTPTRVPTATPLPARASPTPTRIVPPTRTPCVDCQAPAVVAERSGQILVNAGGGEFADSMGQVWLADQEYVQGETNWGYVLGDDESGVFVETRPISGTVDGPLYQDERWAMAGYRFVVPNGRYQVTLRFAEQYVAAAGQRVFSVGVMGDLALRDLDIVGTAGAPFVAVDRVVTVTVTSGLLAIDFIRQIENPTIAAIAIKPVLAPTATPSRTVTPAPTETAPPAPTAVAAPPAPSSAPSPTLTVAPSPTATALPADSRLVALFPQAAATLRSADGSLLAIFPAMAVTQTMLVVCLPEQDQGLAAANAGFALRGPAFRLQSFDAYGMPLTGTVWQEPVTLTLRYSQEDLSQAGGVLSHLMLGRYRPDAGQWEALDAQVDLAGSALVGRIRQPGLYGLLIRYSPPLASAPKDSGMTWFFGGLLLGAAAALIGCAVVRRQSRTAKGDNQTTTQ